MTESTPLMPVTRDRPIANSELSGIVKRVFPSAEALPHDIPVLPREMIKQAVESVHSPVSAILTAARALDEMLIALEINGKDLNAKIRTAVESGKMHSALGEWSHSVRLDANDERHPKPGQRLPTEADARATIDFVKAVGDFLFVYPARLKRGKSVANVDSADGNLMPGAKP